MKKEQKLKAGKYYIGDPCYLFGESWSEVCDILFSDVSPQLFKCDTMLMGGTAYGDGAYLGSNGNLHWVDSGTIGILPISLINIDNKETIEGIEKSEGMHIVEFEKDFDASIENGVFVFGDIVIDTQMEYEDDEDY